MQHKSFFSRPVDVNFVLNLARSFEDGISVVTNDDCMYLDHVARIGFQRSNGISYYDGDVSDLDDAGAGLVITSAHLASLFTCDLIVISRNPRVLFIQLIQALLADNQIDYPRTFSEITLQVSSGRSRVDAGATVAPGSWIGRDCVIETGAIVLPGVILEDGVHLKAGAIVGSSGAAVAVNTGAMLAQPHVGSLVIGSGTEVGAQSNIVRGMFGATTIGNRCVIGNQVNVGHNCRIGHSVWIGAAVVVGGYTCIGNFTNIGMGSICKNGLVIGDNCNVAMGSCLMKSLSDGKSCIGNPARETAFRFSAGPAIELELPDGKV